MSFMLTIPTSGHIFINKALDREKKHEYNFYVNAFDAGDPIQFSMARVQVGIEQNNIFFKLSKTSRSIPEYYCRIDPSFNLGEGAGCE